MRSNTFTSSCLLYVRSLSGAGGSFTLSGSSEEVSPTTQGQTWNLEKEF